MQMRTRLVCLSSERHLEQTNAVWPPPHIEAPGERPREAPLAPLEGHNLGRRVQLIALPPPLYADLAPPPPPLDLGQLPAGRPTEARSYFGRCAGLLGFARARARRRFGFNLIELVCARAAAQTAVACSRACSPVISGPLLASQLSASAQFALGLRRRRRAAWLAGWLAGERKNIWSLGRPTTKR